MLGSRSYSLGVPRTHNHSACREIRKLLGPMRRRKRPMQRAFFERKHDPLWWQDRWQRSIDRNGGLTVFWKRSQRSICSAILSHPQVTSARRSCMWKGRARERVLAGWSQAVFKQSATIVRHELLATAAISVSPDLPHESIDRSPRLGPLAPPAQFDPMSALVVEQDTHAD